VSITRIRIRVPASTLLIADFELLIADWPSQHSKRQTQNGARFARASESVTRLLNRASRKRSSSHPITSAVFWRLRHFGECARCTLKRQTSAAGTRAAALPDPAEVRAANYDERITRGRRLRRFRPVQDWECSIARTDAINADNENIRRPNRITKGSDHGTS
jgi:hypothetical protein